MESLLTPGLVPLPLSWLPSLFFCDYESVLCVLTHDSIWSLVLQEEAKPPFKAWDGSSHSALCGGYHVPVFTGVSLPVDLGSLCPTR